MKILVVDDDLGILNALRAGLSSFGYQVVVAEGGRQALKIIATSNDVAEPVDLIVSDLKMPDMNGLELIRSVRKERPGLASILMTAFGSTDVRKEAMGLGSCEYIEKPFTPQSLLEKIKRLKGR